MLGMLCSQWDSPFTLLASSSPNAAMPTPLCCSIEWAAGVPSAMLLKNPKEGHIQIWIFYLELSEE